MSSPNCTLTVYFCDSRVNYCKKIRITEDAMLIIVQHIIQLFAQCIATSYAMSRSNGDRNQLRRE